MIYPSLQSLFLKISNDPLSLKNSPNGTFLVVISIKINPVEISIQLTNENPSSIHSKDSLFKLEMWT